MQLHQLKSATKRKTAKRIGRGGKRGKTSGRGGKGQTARAGGRPRPELRDMIKRLPKRRGFGKNRARTVNAERVRPYVINVHDLSVFDNGADVTPGTIAAAGIIRVRAGKTLAIKILGEGELSKKVTIKGCLVSKAAQGKIEKAGGSIVR